jgi:RNA polymerase sigma factor (sigma-70 family)
VAASVIHPPVGAPRRSDEQLVASYRKGDEGAFDAIHQRYCAQLVSYARKILGAAQSEAEDVIQEVFLKVPGALLRDSRPIALHAWLYSVVRNRCIDEIRRPKLPVAEVYELSRRLVSDPASCLEGREDLACVMRDMGRLPEQQRLAVTMSAWEGRPYAEIAVELDTSPPAVKSILNRARTTLAQAGEARTAPCREIRDELRDAHVRHARMSGRSRKHMLDCPGCDHFHKRLHGHDLHAATPAHGLISAIGKLLGFGGGAGCGASAAGGGGAAGAMAGANALAGGVLAAKIAAVVSAAAVAGGAAVELDRHRAAPHGSAHPAAVASTRTHEPAAATDTGGALNPVVVSSVRRAVGGVRATARPAARFVVVLESVTTTPGGTPLPRTVIVTRRVTVPAHRPATEVRPAETGGALAPDEPAASTSATAPPAVEPPVAEYTPATDTPVPAPPSAPTEPRREEPTADTPPPAVEEPASDAGTQPAEPESRVQAEAPAVPAEPSVPSASDPSDEAPASSTGSRWSRWRRGGREGHVR